MPKALRLAAFAIFGASAIASAPALAQDAAMRDMASATYGQTVVSLGGGFGYLTLPDTRFTFRYNSGGTNDTVSKQKNDAFDEYGGGLSGSVATPLGGAFGMPWVGAIHGYWTSFNDTNRNKCISTNSEICAAADIVDEPGLSTVSARNLYSHTERDVDSWGVAAELTTPSQPRLLPGLMKSTHWGAAFDVRGLDQDLDINGHGDGHDNLFRYSEGLDTTYYGGYLTWGGEYSLFPALYGGWGLRSFIDLHAGLYSANVDYSGNFTGRGVGAGRLGLSSDEATFIGGVKFETRKQFGPRTSLSLVSEYEYYSYVPAMRYNDGDGRAKGIINETHIADGDAFSERTSLRLNIGFGPAQLYAPPSAEPLK